MAVRRDPQFPFPGDCNLSEASGPSWNCPLSADVVTIANEHVNNKSSSDYADVAKKVQSSTPRLGSSAVDWALTQRPHQAVTEFFCCFPINFLLLFSGLVAPKLPVVLSSLQDDLYPAQKSLLLTSLALVVGLDDAILEKISVEYPRPTGWCPTHIPNIAGADDDNLAQY